MIDAGGIYVNQNSNLQMARRMMIVGLILMILGLLGNIASFVVRLIQNHRWPIGPTVAFVILAGMTALSLRQVRKFWSRQ